MYHCYSLWAGASPSSLWCGPELEIISLKPAFQIPWCLCNHHGHAIVWLQVWLGYVWWIVWNCNCSSMLFQSFSSLLSKCALIEVRELTSCGLYILPWRARCEWSTFILEFFTLLSMQSRKRDCWRVFSTGLNWTLARCPTLLVTYIASFRSSSISSPSGFNIYCFVGDSYAIYAMQKTGCTMFLWNKLVSAPNIDIFNSSLFKGGKN